MQGKSGLPIFVGAMSFAVKMIIDKAARDGDMADGDVYIFNDPYDGGTHLPTSSWCGPTTGAVRSIATSHQSAIGTMSAATCPATTILWQPRAFRRGC